MVEPSLDSLEKLDFFYGVTIDEIVHCSNAISKAITVEDKTASKLVRLIAQLDDKNKSTVMNIIGIMLTKNIQTFFEQNIQTAK